MLNALLRRITAPPGSKKDGIGPSRWMTERRTNTAMELTGVSSSVSEGMASDAMPIRYGVDGGDYATPRGKSGEGVARRELLPRRRQGRGLR